ncbi:phosphopantothenoylcysteine decarboxylase [Embleya sp. NBC_00888]|uniref:flavoprotein n=1 Tax=Embleya sp. NBC_00888 TaxID=2975960 RepID=UPI003863A24E|nr:phosphopantothenoylcysteine decarboxylase [Embleya sp. NBC_00888]
MTTPADRAHAGPPAGVPRHIPLARGRLLLIGTGAFSVVDLPGWAGLLRAWYGWSIQPCLTHAAARLVSREALAAGAGTPVAGPDWFTGAGTGTTPHRELAAWADLILVAPATTNFVAKCALGIPDNLALSIVAGSTCPVVVAPSFPEAVLSRPSAKRNLELLAEEGHYVVPTREGRSVATGLVGPGAMADLPTILRFMASLL